MGRTFGFPRPRQRAGRAWRSAAALLAACLLLRPAAASAQAATLRPRVVRTTVQTQTNTANPALAVITNVANAHTDDDLSSTSAATVEVDREVIPAVTSTSALTINFDTVNDILTVLEDLTADPLLATGNDIQDVTDGTKRELLDVFSVSGMSVTITGDATENHAAGNFYYKTATGGAFTQVERRIFSGGMGDLQGNRPPVVVTASTLLDATTMPPTITLTPVGDLAAAQVVANDRFVDITAVGNTEVLTVLSVLGDVVTFTAMATEAHPIGTQYMRLETRREPPDLAAEFSQWREFPSMAAVTQMILGGDTAQVVVTITNDTAGDFRPANTGANADDFDGDGLGTRDTPDVPDEWIFEILWDTNGDGFFDQIDVDMCDGMTPRGIGAVACGIVEVGRASGVGMGGGTLTANIQAQIRGLAIQPDFENEVWLRVRNERIGTGGGSQLEISDVRIDVAYFPPGSPIVTILPIAIPVSLKNDVGFTPVVFTAAGGAPPYVWTPNWSPAAGPPPGVTEMTSGANNEIYTLTGPATQAGAYHMGLTVADSGANSSHYPLDMLVDGLELIDSTDATRTPLTAIPTPVPGEPYFLAIEAILFDNGGQFPGPALTSNWKCVACAPPAGMFFEPIMPVTTAPGVATVNLRGTPTSTTYDISALTAVDHTYAALVDGGLALGSPAQQTAFTDVLTGGAGAEDIRLIRRGLPDAVIGLRYTTADPAGATHDPLFPPLAVLQAVNAGGAAPSVTWSVVGSASGIEIPPGTSLALMENPLDETQAEILGADLIDLIAGGEPGTYTFTVRAVDDLSAGKFHQREYSFTLLGRETVLINQPPRSTGDTRLRFTVFGSGGVPSAGTGFAPLGDEVRDGATGVPHYQLQYRVDPQILPGDDPADDTDAGKYMGDAGVLDVDYQSPWMNTAGTRNNAMDPATPGWVDFPDPPNNTWPGITSPARIDIDLNTDGNIADPPTPKLSLTPTVLAQTCTPRRYRVRFRALDAITRGAPNVLTELGSQPFLDEAGTVITIEPPEDCSGGISLRQERFD